MWFCFWECVNYIIIHKNNINNSYNRIFHDSAVVAVIILKDNIDNAYNQILYDSAVIVIFLFPRITCGHILSSVTQSFSNFNGCFNMQLMPGMEWGSKTTRKFNHHLEAVRENTEVSSILMKATLDREASVNTREDVNKHCWGKGLEYFTCNGRQIFIRVIWNLLQLSKQYYKW